MQDISKLQENERYHDVYFKIGDPLLEGDLSKYERISSVRMILAARSLVFEKMLYGPWVESQEGLDVEIPDTEPEIFRILLEFIFSDSTNQLNSRNLKKVHQIADKYAVPGLVKECLTFIKQHRRVMNIFLERNLKKYHGVGFPPYSHAEKVSYFTDFSVGELREAVASQLQLPEDRLQFWALRNPFHIPRWEQPGDAINNVGDRSLSLDTFWKDAIVNGCNGVFFVRVLENTEIRCSVKSEVICFKYLDVETMTLRFVGTCVYDASYILASTMFDDFNNLVQGKVDATFIIQNIYEDDEDDEDDEYAYEKGRGGIVYLGFGISSIFVFTDSYKSEYTEFYRKEYQRRALLETYEEF